MGDSCWNTTGAVPTQVTHDAKPRWYSITEAFQTGLLIIPHIPGMAPPTLSPPVKTPDGVTCLCIQSFDHMISLCS